MSERILKQSRLTQLTVELDGKIHEERPPGFRLILKKTCLAGQTTAGYEVRQQLRELYQGPGQQQSSSELTVTTGNH